MRIKVCGMTEIDQIQQLAEMNVDYAGLIFYERSPRFVANQIDPSKLRKLANKIKITGVFVNEHENIIEEKINAYNLSAVQLCGMETIEDCNRLKKYAEVIKVFHMSPGFSAEEMKGYENACNYLLFDTKSEKYGGTGQQFDWSLIASQNFNMPFFLSGGISANDIPVIKKFSHHKLFGIDVNSQFEISPGKKDLLKIKNFIDQLK